MSQRIIHEAAVTATCTRTNFVCFNQHDFAIGVALFGDYRRPKTRETATNHAQVAVFVVNCCGVRVGLVNVV